MSSQGLIFIGEKQKESNKKMAKLNDDNLQELEAWILKLLIKSKRYQATDEELASEIITRIREIFELKK